MYKSGSLVTAENVTNRAMQIVNQAQSGIEDLDKVDQNEFRVLIESYQNGREQGHLVWPLFASDTAYYICEPRGSDGTCIYRGKYAMQSISPDAYKHANMFRDVDEAATWLVKDLIELFLATKAKKEKKK